MSSIAKILTTLLLTALLPLAFCACTIDISGLTDGGDYPDKLYQKKEGGETLYVFRLGDKYFDVESSYDVDLDTDREIEDGEFVKITADVTYLSGGTAGFKNKPQIDNIYSIETVSIEDLDVPSLYDTNTGLMSLNEVYEADYFFCGCGYTAAYKDGKWLYKYDYNLYADDPEKCFYYCESVTEEEMESGYKNGEYCCEDYFAKVKFK